MKPGAQPQPHERRTARSIKLQSRSFFRSLVPGQVILFIPAGGNRVDPSKAAVAAGERLGRADAPFVGTQTGFAIGGVAPVGHLSAPKAVFDSTLLKFDVVYAAAGTRY
jgi:prolyl-tRNA editing enzyme YbaK/EbsC (Cys-tRNA(Pro) deacylase)